MSAFDIHVSGHWLDTNWIPPRCRKPRTREVPIDTTVSIPSVGLDAAPIAFRITGLGVREIRLWDGRLFESYAAVSRQTGPTVPGTPRFPAQVGERTRMVVHDAAEWLDDVSEHYATFVIIDHQVWRETGEPRYHVQTFGLGANHGGTSLFATTGHDQSDSYFRADNFNAAYAHAVQVATDRGDTESIDTFTQDIEVVMPGAVTLEVSPPESPEVRNARSDLRQTAAKYRDAVRSDSNAAEAEAWTKLIDARSFLEVVGSPMVAEVVSPQERPHLRPRTVRGSGGGSVDD